jgi:hypothetical protein
MTKKGPNGKAHALALGPRGFSVLPERGHEKNSSSYIVTQRERERERETSARIL